MRKNILILLAVFLCGGAYAQTATNVGLVLVADSSANVIVPRIVKVLPNTAADAEPDIMVNHYLLKVDDVHCRNIPFSKVIDIINNGDEEGTPVSLVISDEKNIYPKYPFVLRRGKPVQPTPTAPAQMNHGQ